MSRKKIRQPRKSLTYGRVSAALVDAMHWAYSQHEASTSDPYLKRRISNATEQVVTRTLLKLFPKLSVQRGTTLREWRPTFEDVDRFRAQVGLLEARMR